MIRRLFSRLFECQCHGCRCRRGEVIHQPVSTAAEPGVVWARLPDCAVVALNPRQARLMADFLRDSAGTAEWLLEVRQGKGKRVDVI